MDLLVLGELCPLQIDSRDYHVIVSQDFREKNHDQVREDIITVLRATRSSFIQEVISKSPAALFRWSILRAVVRAMFAFRSAPKQSKGKHISVRMILATVLYKAFSPHQAVTCLPLLMEATHRLFASERHAGKL